MDFNELNELKLSKLEQLGDKWELPIADYLHADDLEGILDHDDLYEFLSDTDFFQVEIIYYSKAIKFLSENDASLSESMSLADEMGFTLNNINSETLASLLASEQRREEFSDLQNEIDEILTETCVEAND